LSADSALRPNQNSDHEASAHCAVRSHNDRFCAVSPLAALSTQSLTSCRRKASAAPAHRYAYPLPITRSRPIVQSLIRSRRRQHSTIPGTPGSNADLLHISPCRLWTTTVLAADQECESEVEREIRTVSVHDPLSSSPRLSYTSQQRPSILDNHHRNITDYQQRAQEHRRLKHKRRGVSSACIPGHRCVSPAGFSSG
jgi:hypothetical protein